MTKLVILGAAGRMGEALIRCAQREPKTRVVAAIEKSGHPEIGQPVAIAPELTLSDDWAGAARADVVIDFTFHTAVAGNLSHAVKAGLAVVLGTTGLSDAERDAVDAAAKRVPVVWAPNMSLGVNVLMDLLTRAAETLGDAYDIEIVEMQHRHKQDAPSGTALALAQSVARGRPDPRELSQRLQHGREGFTGERDAGEIGMHALRGGDVVGDHTVIFAAEGERIELSHKASSRDAFAMGAIQAAMWISGKTPGLYTMRNVLGLDPV